MLFMGLIIVPILIYDDMKSSDAKKDLKNITPIICSDIKSETDEEILEKIKKREDESEALRKILLNLSEPAKIKRKHHK